MVFHKVEAKTKDEAIEKGLDIYFTGEPCKNGHVTHRFTATGKCSDCRHRYMSKANNKLYLSKKNLDYWGNL